MASFFFGPDMNQMDLDWTRDYEVTIRAEARNRDSLRGFKIRFPARPGPANGAKGAYSEIRVQTADDVCRVTATWAQTEGFVLLNVLYSYMFLGELSDEHFLYDTVRGYKDFPLRKIDINYQD